VLASVSGPLSPRLPSKEESSAIISLLIKSGKATSTLETEWEAFLSQILSTAIETERYPRSVIQIVIQIIQADGSVLSCCLHAAVAALMDAGISLSFLPVATTCLVSTTKATTNPQGSIVRLDPVQQEELDPDNSIVVVVNDNVEPSRIRACHTLGPNLSIETLLTCTQVAAKAAPAVVAFWRLAVEQKVTRESQTLWSN